MSSVFTTREVGEFLGVPEWKVRRLFQDGTLPDPGRVGLYRAIPRSWFPRIIDELRNRGWLPADGTPVEANQQ